MGMLNVPLQSVLHQQQHNNQSGAHAAATYLAQQHILAQAANSGDASLGQKIASLGGLANNSSAASLLSQYTASQPTNSVAAVAFAQQINEARAASLLAAATAQSHNDNSMQQKRKLSELSNPNSAEHGDQRQDKRSGNIGGLNLHTSNAP